MHSSRQNRVLAHCGERLAGFKTPKHVVVTDAPPKYTSGKVLERDLGARYADPASSEPT